MVRVEGVEVSGKGGGMEVSGKGGGGGGEW